MRRPSHHASSHLTHRILPPLGRQQHGRSGCADGRPRYPETCIPSRALGRRRRARCEWPGAANGQVLASASHAMPVADERRTRRGHIM